MHYEKFHSKQKLAFVDIETTGLNSAMHEIIEIAIIREQDGKVLRWSTKIKPMHLRVADPRALEINGYNEEEWADAPVAADVAAEIGSWIEDCHLVGHNVHFDSDFIEQLLYQNSVPYRARRRQIDTITLAHEHLYFWPAHSLQNLRTFFGMCTSGAHRAMKDCEDMRTIYHRLRRACGLHRAVWRLRAIWLQHKWRSGRK